MNAIAAIGGVMCVIYATLYVIAYRQSNNDAALGEDDQPCDDDEQFHGDNTRGRAYVRFNDLCDAIEFQSSHGSAADLDSRYLIVALDCQASELSSLKAAKGAVKVDFEPFAAVGVAVECDD
jgi:hypothetical protein